MATERIACLPVLVDVLMLVLETGTAVTFFFTRDTDLFALTVISARRKFSVGGERRVLTLPSGWLLVREVDFELLVSLAGDFRVGVPVGGGEDAEGDWDSGFKVQICDFCWRERIFSYNLP